MFAPFAPILARLATLAGAAGEARRLPTVEEIDAACSVDAGVRFELAPPRPRRSPRPPIWYDERIEAGVVPTRASSVHDLMNAIVWAAFPRSKRLVHTQQLALLRASGDHSRRSAEHDTIAMLDEGGVLFAGTPEAPDAVVVFGHAILEHVATRDDAVFGLGVSMDRVARVDASARERLDELDRELAGMLVTPGRFVSHRSFPRVRVCG